MLYVILYGFAVMRGAISEPIMEFAWRAMRIVVVVLLATNSSAFQQYVTGLFFDSLPKEIGNALAGSGLNTSSGLLSISFSRKGSMLPTRSTIKQE
ncbi:type IV secretion system protein VirB6 (plasmid) [Bradyrhizobium guangxiense]